METTIFTELGLFWAFLGAAVAATMGAIGSSVGSGLTGQAATGLAAEKPELGMKAIILQALPGSQAIYGFVALFFVLFIVLETGKAGTPEAGKALAISAEQGFQVFAACIPVGISGYFSGLFQGKVLAGAMNMLAKDEGTFANAMIMGAIVETFAILGLLGSILMLLKI